ncbi:hypothetical protein AAC387_Pa05g0814 [Persea americana]
MVRQFIALALLLLLVVSAFANDYDFVLTPIPSPTEEVALSLEAKKEFADNDHMLPPSEMENLDLLPEDKKEWEAVLGMHGAFNPFQVPIADGPMYYADSPDITSHQRRRRISGPRFRFSDSIPIGEDREDRKEDSGLGLVARRSTTVVAARGRRQGDPDLLQQHKSIEDLLPSPPETAFRKSRSRTGIDRRSRRTAAASCLRRRRGGEEVL